MPLMIPDLSPFPTVVLVGLGNIGSQAIDALGRLKVLKRAVLVDPDAYTESNLASQRIHRRDVNQFKARVQARRLAEINPGLEVVTLIDSIANVPRGLLRGAVILAGLHSAAARRDACEAAWRVGAPLIDGGVDPLLGLGRVTGYVPRADAPCWECGLDEEDYQNMPAPQLCGAGDEDEMPTNGSPSLGALVAALLVIEAEKLLAGRIDGSLAGRQLVVDVTQHRQFVTRLDRNPKCRFDHARRDIRPLTGITEHSTLGDALEAARAALGAGGEVSLGVDGHEFAKALHCPGCGASKDLLAVPERLPHRARSCIPCAGRAMLAVGFKKRARVSAADVPARVLRRSLRLLGVRAGDVLVAGDSERQGYFEVPHE